MKFYLKRDKNVFGETGAILTFIESGAYEVVRIFDNKRVMIDTSHGKPRQLTLLRLTDGELDNV